MLILAEELRVTFLFAGHAGLSPISNFFATTISWGPVLAGKSGLFHANSTGEFTKF